MSSRARPHPIGVAEATYVELVRSALATLLPVTIMGIVFVIVSTHVLSRTDDILLECAAGLGILLSLARVGLLLPHASRASLEAMDMATALRTERTYAAAYLSFAATVGVFGARTVAVGAPEVVPATIALLCGYAAGATAGVALRPWIAVPALLLAVLPTVLVAVVTGETHGQLLGFTMAAFLVAGIASVLRRFRSDSEKIAMRRVLNELARHDPLTGLANRIGLSDGHEAAAAADPSRTIAVHCLDLDRFKAVNDQHGHPVGDALLRAAAERLTRLLRDCDLAARLGGDEFVVLQTGLAHPGEADLFARRISKELAKPYLIEGLTLSVGASIGFAVGSAADRPLDELLEEADRASYCAKRRGSGMPEPAAAAV